MQQKSAAAAAAGGGGGATAAPGTAGAPGAPGRGRALAERKKLEGKHGTVWTYSRLIAKRRADDAAAASRESDKGRGGNGNHKESAQANDSATLLRQFEELWNSPRRMGRRASQVHGSWGHGRTRACPAAAVCVPALSQADRVS